jgi:hypothetical protein
VVEIKRDTLTRVSKTTLYIACGLRPAVVSTLNSEREAVHTYTDTKTPEGLFSTLIPILRLQTNGFYKGTCSWRIEFTPSLSFRLGASSPSPSPEVSTHFGPHIFDLRPCFKPFRRNMVLIAVLETMFPVHFGPSTNTFHLSSHSREVVDCWPVNGCRCVCFLKAMNVQDDGLVLNLMASDICYPPRPIPPLSLSRHGDNLWTCIKCVVWTSLVLFFYLWLIFRPSQPRILLISTNSLNHRLSVPNGPQY